MATLVPLSAADPQAVEDLLDAAFGRDRHARTAYRIRAGTEWLPGLSFAALDDADRLVGSIQVWPVALTRTGSEGHARAHPLLMVGPVAVRPGLQGAGYGKAMMAAALGAAEAAGALPQVLIGDEDYYGRWGFTSAHTRGWRCPGPYDPARLLVRCANSAVLPVEGLLGPWEPNSSPRRGGGSPQG